MSSTDAAICASHGNPAPHTSRHELTTFPPAVLRQFREGAFVALARNPGDSVVRMRIADLTRALGDLDEAARLYQEASQDGGVLASHLAALLRNEPAISLPENLPSPVPFVRRMNALPDTTVGAIWDHLDRNRSQFRASQIYEGSHRWQTRTETRNSCRLGADAALRALICPHLSALLADDLIWTCLRLPRFEADHTEMEAAVHSNGGRFGPHRDCGGPAASRRLTFIFYLHRQPKRFTGGDLLLHDEPGNTSGFTRIEPAHNSLIVFPASALHQVTPVKAPPGDLLDGRITLHGWLHCRSEQVQ